MKFIWEVGDTKSGMIVEGLGGESGDRFALIGFAWPSDIAGASHIYKLTDLSTGRQDYSGDEAGLIEHLNKYKAIPLQMAGHTCPADFILKNTGSLGK